MKRIYFDNNATTAVDPQALKIMTEELAGPPANPSSLHWFGQRAKGLLQSARQDVAHFFRCKSEEIFFTSGGTEGMNGLIRGLGNKGHVISTTIEHSCVYKSLQEAEERGLSVSYLPVGLWGAPTVEQIAAAIQPDTRALILSAANNETGVKIPLGEIAELAEKRNILFFLDAVAFIGKELFQLHPGISAVALSGHKFHGPKGVGALFIRSSIKLNQPLLIGGGQERQMRAGTENLAGILGLSEALKILEKGQGEIGEYLRSLRLPFEEELQRRLPHLKIHGEGPRISNTTNIAFPGVDGETLLIQLDMVGIAASHGSACASGAIEPSRVLTQMGIDRKMARSSLRFSFSRMNTREEIEEAVERIIPYLRSC